MQNSPKTGILTLFPKTLRLFMGGMILANIAAMMYDPLLPLYLQHLGADVRQVGLFFTVAAVLPLLFQIFGGWISDSIGRLRAVAIGSVANMLTFVIFLLSPTWEWVLIAMATSAIGRSFVAPSFRAFIAEQSTENNRGKIYGIADTVFAVVGVFGPPLGGFLSDQYGYTVMFLVAGGIFTLATIMRVVMAIAAGKQQRRSAAEATERPSWSGLKTSLTTMFGLLFTGGLVTWILISDGIIDVNFSMIGQLMPIYMRDQAGITNTQIGILNSIASIVTMALMLFTGWLSDRKGEHVAITAGLVIMSSSMLVFVISRSFSSMVIAWILFGMGQALVGPAYSSLISKAVPEKLRGVAFGLFSTSVGFVSLPAPVIGAFLWETFNPSVPFILPAAALLIVAPIAWFKFKISPAQPLPPSGQGVPANAD
ncbi:MAG: hypothetical protein CVU39_23030 [Chloroflexi bacterium HGW-Chloroflexi-10]|nr:MAG: hypothetical protein CVU39_23030 [Chloroflexi bacterium HGW-Chloroflexi-10]